MKIDAIVVHSLGGVSIAYKNEITYLLPEEVRELYKLKCGKFPQAIMAEVVKVAGIP